VRRSSRGRMSGTAVASWPPPAGQVRSCCRISSWWLPSWRRRPRAQMLMWIWDLSTLPTTWVCGRGGRNLRRRRRRSQPSSWTRYVPLSCSNLCPHAVTVLTMQRFDFQKKRQRWFRVLKFVYSTGKIIVNLVFSWRRIARRSCSGTRRSSSGTRRALYTPSWSPGLHCRSCLHAARAARGAPRILSCLPDRQDDSADWVVLWQVCPTLGAVSRLVSKVGNG
jgi:hypothetical protein